MKKKKQEQIELLHIEQKYTTKKILLKKILKKSIDNKPLNEIKIKQLVTETNQLVIDAYHFVRLYFLFCFKENKDLPVLDDLFFMYCLRVLCFTDSKKGGKYKDPVLFNNLQTFYTAEYKTVVNHEPYSLENKSQLLKYLATELATAYKNNVIFHFYKHFSYFVNITTKSICNDKKIIKLLKENIIDRDLSNINGVFEGWANTHLYKSLPVEFREDNTDEKRPLLYHLKVHTDKFLYCMLYMTNFLETHYNNNNDNGNGTGMNNFIGCL
jgi:hypothetical protein